jgi:hypothetical protein
LPVGGEAGNLNSSAGRVSFVYFHWRVLTICSGSSQMEEKPTAGEAPGVEPVFREKDQAIGYAETRACFRTGEICILDPAGKLERVIAFARFEGRSFSGT